MINRYVRFTLGYKKIYISSLLPPDLKLSKKIIFSLELQFVQSFCPDFTLTEANNAAIGHKLVFMYLNHQEKSISSFFGNLCLANQ